MSSLAGDCTLGAALLAGGWPAVSLMSEFAFKVCFDRELCSKLLETLDGLGS
jgi:hypothetical protein